MTEPPMDRGSMIDPATMPPSDPLPSTESVSPPAAGEAADAADAPNGGAGAPAAAEMGADLDPADASLLGLIDRLAGLLERTDLTELEVQVGSTGLVLRKPSALAPPAIPVAAGAAAAADGAATAPGGDTDLLARPSVKAPLSGIWYGSPAPGSAPYVTLGGEVAVGQVIGLIEAMKLFNEIKSDLAGRVVKINAENGKLVRAKQPLIEVDPL
jgi:acetyl-CoA carboxylase biotin carboxyl carrier protein